MATGELAASSPRPSPFAIFRNRSFSLLWIGQLVSTIGTALTSLASSIFIYRLTGSAMSVGLMLMATAAPTVLVGLVAGVFVDRYDRKRILIIADLLRALFVFLIPVLVPSSVAWLYVMVMLSSTVGQFYDPAHESVLPEVASEDELAAANALMAISSFGATAIGFAASGLIASQANIMWAFILDGATFIFSAVCVLLVRIKPLEIQERTTVRMMLDSLRGGMRYLLGTPVLRSLFMVSTLMLVSFGLSNSLLLPFASRALGANEFQYGVQEGLTSLGFVASSLLMAGIFDRMREGPWLTISWIGMALCGIAYSRSASVPMAIAILMISGFLNAPASIARRVIVQRNTPRELRGRVNSAFFVSRDILYLVGMAAAGLADIVDVRIMYLVSALLVLAAGAWVPFLPGLKQEAAEWRRALSLLRNAPTAPKADISRSATLSDMDLLAGLLPATSRLPDRQRRSLLATSQVVRAPAGSAIIRHGEVTDSVYFVLSGRAVAGIATAGGQHRELSTMGPGDWFGEIAALTGAPRTADVVAQDEMTLLQVSAGVLRELMAQPAMGQLILSRMAERLNRTSLAELPRFAGYDQRALREMRAAAFHQLPEQDDVREAALHKLPEE